MSVDSTSNPASHRNTEAANSTQQFLREAVAVGALKFGSFTLKSGRVSPYFFNAGLFSHGRALHALASAYAHLLQSSGLAFDMLFGPAYKGIALAAATAMRMFEVQQRNIAFCYNRKEVKDHGEGGNLVGAPLAGRVVIVDDVISAGTSVRESIQIIQAAGATPAAVLIALDRQERGSNADQALSAAQEVTQQFGIPVLAVAGLDDLLGYLEQDQQFASIASALMAYRTQYGV